MKKPILFAGLLLIIGLGLGYSAASVIHPQTVAESPALSAESQRLLRELQTSVAQLESRPAHTVATESCPDITAALPQIRAAVQESLVSLMTRPATALDTPSAATSAEEPTAGQQELYSTIEERLYSYATSGEPLLQAMTADPQFQQLAPAQKKQLALEVVQRFNRGELTMEQIQGR